MYQDPIQFAYRRDVRVDETFLRVLHKVYSHLESVGASVYDDAPYTRFDVEVSAHSVTNAGAPQSTVFSPFLFTLYSSH